MLLKKQHFYLYCLPVVCDHLFSVLKYTLPGTQEFSSPAESKLSPATPLENALCKVLSFFYVALEWTLKQACSQQIHRGAMKIFNLTNIKQPSS